MKKLLIITQYFYPENFRINDISLELKNRGYDVTVLTGIPNYPLGDIYEGYERKYCEEDYNGIQVIRLPIHERGHNKITLALNCYSFVSLGKKWIDKIAKINGGSLPYDVIFTFEVSPMTQGLIGAYATKKYGIKSIIYVQDLWPENVIEILGVKNPMIIKPIEKIVEKIYRDTNIILATSNSFVLEIQKRIKNKSTINKVKYWPQYAEDFYKPMGKHIDGYSGELDDGVFRVCFTGNIGKTQGLEILAECAKLIKKEYKEENRSIDIKFIIVGDGRNRNEFEKKLKELDVFDIFDMLGKKNAVDIPQILSICDAAFVSFIDNKVFSMTIPAKLQSYLACGMPILASAIGETSDIVSKNSLGLVSNVGDILKLKENIIKMKNDNNALRNYGINSRNYFLTHFDKKILMDELETMLK